MIVSIMVLMLAACGITGNSLPQSGLNQPVQNNAAAVAEPSGTPAPSSEAVQTPSRNNVLVAYFSCTGNTRSLAEYAADTMNAALYEIQPETPYTAADLNYRNRSSRSIVEQNDNAARPAISGTVENMDEYDVVFLGYPIWNGQAPRIISTFLESHDFSGKTIIPFCTSGSSGIGSSAANLHGLADSAVWLPGMRFPVGASKDDIAAWINSLDFQAGNAAEKAGEEGGENIMYLQIGTGNKAFSVALADNPAAEALKELLAENPITINMSDYGGFEKVGGLGTNLPRNDASVTTEPGDLVLYQGNQLVIFYGQNAWSYTRLGKISDVTQDELKKALGGGNVTVTLSLTQ